MNQRCADKVERNKKAGRELGGQNLSWVLDALDEVTVGFPIRGVVHRLEGAKDHVQKAKHQQRKSSQNFLQREGGRQRWGLGVAVPRGADCPHCHGEDSSGQKE